MSVRTIWFRRYAAATKKKTYRAGTFDYIGEKIVFLRLID
jgi:predicted alpha/beta hydrolase